MQFLVDEYLMDEVELLRLLHDRVARMKHKVSVVRC